MAISLRSSTILLALGAAIESDQSRASPSASFIVYDRLGSTASPSTTGAASFAIRPSLPTVSTADAAERNTAAATSRETCRHHSFAIHKVDCVRRRNQHTAAILSSPFIEDGPVPRINVVGRNQRILPATNSYLRTFGSLHAPVNQAPDERPDQLP